MIRCTRSKNYLISSVPLWPAAAPKSYEFGYQVKDDYSGNNYKRQEASDGNQVQGEYRVQLPDGRTQIVTYYADWQTGFHADVRYEGEAHYPENYGNGYNTYGAPGFGPGYNGGIGNVGPQYGPPAYAGGHHGAGGYNLNNFNNPATSQVSIKDYSGPGAPYNVGGGYGNGHHVNNGFGGYGDSYANAGNFGHKVRPSNVYGAP
ncbi:hypothetical protein ILUMI_18946 [Ignelater luminosus]|uniref:Uncharacterized protein n=1 Tax=Ignelater luminosus TaxID=2038154 RepID=A0A8K0CH24_IGNLU|nr:hypothetical protein ILUMI_18946 [Ignelater luminosus]